jgi:MFS family permease
VSALLSQGDTRRRMASLVTEVMSPAVPIVIVIFIVAVHSAGAGRGLLLGWVAAFFAAGLPYGVVLIGVRRGRLTDHHVSRREQRPRMMAISLVSVAAGLLLLLWLDAPRALFALVASMVAGLAVTLAVTSFWKISIQSWLPQTHLRPA